jgi:hypothetical protein
MERPTLLKAAMRYFRSQIESHYFIQKNANLQQLCQIWVNAFKRQKYFFSTEVSQSRLITEFLAKYSV